jgi:hypothetical protein
VVSRGDFLPTECYCARDLTFDDIGEQTLKNIARSIRVYRVRLTSENSHRPAGTPVQGILMVATRDSWSRQRRVIAKAEWTAGAANPRFVVIALQPSMGVRS